MKKALFVLLAIVLLIAPVAAFAEIDTDATIVVAQTTIIDNMDYMIQSTLNGSGIFQMMYDELIDRLTAAGYEHYEISNFARKDGNQRSPWRSRHNSSYWHDTPYIGLGAGAHSYYRRTRHWNPNDIRRYIDSINNGKLPYEEELIDDDTHYDDIVTTALRTSDGIDLSSLTAPYRQYLMTCAKDYLRRGLLIAADGHLKLSRQGINISNTIMSDLMHV